MTGSAAATAVPDPATVEPAAPDSDAPSATALEDSPVGDSERLALGLRSIDLDVHLNADSGAMTTRARIRLRNDGASALTRIALQISSALRWQSARLVEAKGPGVMLRVEQFRVTTDADHTGAATESALTLPKALAPGAEAELDLYYGGVLRPSGERLLRLGAPESRAAAADWDMVTPGFTGLRGFGNVLWFPVAAPATLLADGARFARAVDNQRQRTAATTLSLTLKLEHTGSVPLAAWFLSRPMPMEPTLRRHPDVAATAEASPASADIASDTADAEPSAIDTARWDPARLDGRPVSLFLTAEVDSANGAAAIHVRGGDSAVRDRYREAAARVVAVLGPWLPARPSALTALALPTPGTQAFADGDLLVASLRADNTAALAEALAYPLAAAAAPADASAWFREGMPEFFRLLYLESTGGRDRVLAELGANAPALREAEAARGMDPTPLASCVDMACARTKAAYALWMLRRLAGDAALQQALAALFTVGEEPDARTATRRFEAALTQSSGKDLGWFFRDWFDADRGLPDLSIVQVAPRQVERGVASVTAPRPKRPVAGPIGAEPEAEPDDPRRASPTAASRNAVGLPDGSWLVAVEVQNNGDVAAEVPVTVRAAGLQNTLPLRVPAHGRATIRVPFETTPEEVWVNDGTTPEQRAGTHRRSITFGAAQ